MDILRRSVELILLRRGSVVESTSNFRRMREDLEKDFIQLFKVDIFKYKIPKCFVPAGVDRPTIYEGAYLDLKAVLGDMLLDVDVQDLHLRPPNNVNESGHTVLGEPAFHEYFRVLSEYTLTQYGADVYPLAVNVSSDDLYLNKTGSRNSKPVYISIANKKAQVYWKKGSVRCIGFAPSEMVSQ